MSVSNMSARYHPNTTTHLHGWVKWLSSMAVRAVTFSLLFAGLPLTAQTASAATYTVTNNAASGTGSFLDAFTSANVSGHSDTIIFDSTAFAPATRTVAQRTITLGANLVTLVTSITINGDVNGDLIPDVILNGGGFNGIATATASTSVTLRSMEFTNFATSTGTAPTVLRAVAAPITVTISDCLFYANIRTAASLGGGVMYVGGTGTTLSIDRSVFYSNRAALNGGAIYYTGSGGGGISNSAFYDNQADGTTAGNGGGAIRYQSGTAGSTLSLYNVTMVGNRVPNGSAAGGGIQGSSFSGTNLNIYDSLIVDNTGPGGASSDINAYSSVLTTTNVTTGSGTGLFVNEGSGASRDLRLVSGSGAIDAGSATSSSPNATYDRLNNPREIGTNVDRGAYEYAAARTLTLDADNSSGSSGNNYQATGAPVQNVQVNVADTDTAIGTISGDTNVRGVSLTLGGILDGASESLVLTGSNPNINAVQYDASANRLLLYSTPAATVADMQNAIHAVAYENAAASPTAGARTVAVVVSDASDSSAATATITLAASPTVSGISPISGSGSGGTSVVITGTNLTGATAVKFGSTDATSYTVDSGSQITATSPSGTGTVHVTVTTAGGTSTTSASDQFTYVAVPSVTGISPTSGPTAGGTSVIITGTNLTGATAVMFGTNAAASFSVDSATQITAASPAGTAGTVHITVTTVGGTSATGASDQFTYVAAPTISGISPTSGPVAGGTSVIITGTNLTGATAVMFGSNAAASFSVDSATQITAASPAGTAGTVDITVTTVGGTSATGASDQFSYVTAPTITSEADTSFTYGDAGSFTVTTGGYPAPALTRSDALPLGVTFVDNGNGTATISGTPNALGAFTITITASNGAGSVSQSFTLTVAAALTDVSAVDANIAVTPDRHLFGVETLGSCGTSTPVTFTVRNIGSTLLTLGTLTLGGTDAGEFAFGIDSCSGNGLAAGATCTAEVKFCPTTLGSKTATLQIPSDAPETPVIAAFLYNHESTREEAARRMPPVLERLNIPNPMSSGQQYTITWSLLGYDEDYLSRVAFFDCSGIPAGSCGNSFASNFDDSGNIPPVSTVTGDWTYNGVTSKRFDYSYTFTAPVVVSSTDIVIRFYRKSQGDNAAGKGSLSLLVPGNVLQPGTDYYDLDGRRLLHAIVP